MVPEAREFNLSLESQYLNISNKSDEANDEEVVIAHCAVNETDDEWSVIHAKFESRGFPIMRFLVPPPPTHPPLQKMTKLQNTEYTSYCTP